MVSSILSNSNSVVYTEINSCNSHSKFEIPESLTKYIITINIMAQTYAVIMNFFWLERIFFIDYLNENGNTQRQAVLIKVIFHYRRLDTDNLNTKAISAALFFCYQTFIRLLLALNIWGLWLYQSLRHSCTFSLFRI